MTVPEDVAGGVCAVRRTRRARGGFRFPGNNLAAVRNTARQYGVGAHEIGKVTGDNTLRIEYKGRAVLSARVPPLARYLGHSLKRILKVQ